jgi:hypothetical protein
MRFRCDEHLLASVALLTVLPDGNRHHLSHLMATRFEETHMNKPTNSFSLRATVEKVFAGLAAVFTVTVTLAATVQMCFPTIA